MWKSGGLERLPDSVLGNLGPAFTPHELRDLGQGTSPFPLYSDTLTDLTPWVGMTIKDRENCLEV